MERVRMRLWTPVKRLLSWSKYDIADDVENDEDDDPGKWNSCILFPCLFILFCVHYEL